MVDHILLLQGHKEALQDHELIFKLHFTVPVLMSFSVLENDFFSNNIIVITSVLSIYSVLP